MELLTWSLKENSWRSEWSWRRSGIPLGRSRSLGSYACCRSCLQRRSLDYRGDPYCIWPDLACEFWKSGWITWWEFTNVHQKSLDDQSDLLYMGITVRMTVMVEWSSASDLCSDGWVVRMWVRMLTATSHGICVFEQDTKHTCFSSPKE